MAPFLFPDDFDEDAFPAAAIELAVENLLPWTKVELSARYRNHDFASHQLALDVRIGIVFPGIVVTILVDRFMGRQFLKDFVVVGEQTWLIIVDVNTRTDVHGIDEAEPFLNSALLQRLFHLRGNVQIRPSGAGFECEFFSIGLHDSEQSRTYSTAACCGILRRKLGEVL
jgi:hypothetical protein